jgi:MraZ protein
MFLSTYENKLDKKGRVSVPASFRSHLSNLGYNGVICYPSFNNSSIEACSQDRIEKISSAIDSLNPFEEKRDFFATSILAEIACCLLVKAKLSKFGNQQHLKNLRLLQEKKQI